MDLNHNLKDSNTRNYVVIRFGKIHWFINTSPRLLDLRGRNAFLVIIRKLVAELISSFIDGLIGPHKSKVVRCGGNAIYVSFPNMNYELMNSLLQFIRSITDFLCILCDPITISAKLIVNGRITWTYEALQPLFTKRTHHWELSIGSNAICNNVLCNICGSSGIGVDYSVNSPVIRHVVRDERSCCVKDLTLRLLGRVFTNPGVITVFTSLGSDDRLPIEWIDEKVYLRAADCGNNVISMKFTMSSGPFNVELRVRFFRHYDIIGDRLIINIVVIKCFTHEEPVSASAVVIGVPKVYLVKEPELSSKSKAGFIDVLSDLYSEYSKSINRLILEGSLSEFNAKINEISKKLSEEFINLLKHILKDISSYSSQSASKCEKLFTDQIKLGKLINLPRDKTCLCVFPIQKDISKSVYIDTELSYVNLDGSSAHDLDSIASKGESVAFIRCDGDHFGIATNPIELLRQEPIMKVIRALTQNVTYNAVNSINDFINWDSLIESLLCKYIRFLTPILFRSEGFNPLVIYIGGDENLLIAAISRENINSVMNALKNFRKSLLIVVATAIMAKLLDKEVIGNKTIMSIINALKESKVGTLSAAVIITKAKVPAYYIVLHANKGVDLAKASGRDSLTLYTITSLNIDDPENAELWLSEPIVSPIPFESRGLDCIEKLMNAYNYIYNNPEVISCMHVTLDYCLRKSLSFSECLDLINEVLSPIIQSRNVLNDLAGCLRMGRSSRSAYATIELIRYLDKGV